MKKLFILFILLTCAFQLKLKAGEIENLSFVPTFENCSFYYDYEGTVTVDKSWNTAEVFRLSIRQEGIEEWQETFSPVYDSERSQFRGSIFNLTENTTYQVKLEIKENGAWSEKGEADFKTWNSNPPLRSTIQLSNLPVYQENQGVEFSGMKGSEDAWIKIVGNVPVNASTTADQAILIDNCEYLILENFTITGGRLHGVNIKDNCKNIRVVGADISAWGRIAVDQVYLADSENYPASKYAGYDGAYIDELGELIRNDAGVNLVTSSNNTSRAHSNFVVERCYIHDQNGYSNAWNDIRILGTGKGKKIEFQHPQGPHGIYVRASGGTVIRYNDVVGSDKKRLHDVSGGMDNGKPLGGYYRDSDIYGNYFGFCQDDGIELDGGQQNVRLYNNRIEQARCGISTAPNLIGPSYLIGNIVNNLSDSQRENSAAVKNGGGTTYSLGMIYFINNTFYIDKNCIAGVGYGSDDNRLMFQGYTRNNILFSTEASHRYTGNGIYETDAHPNNSFDYDLLANSGNPNTEGAIYVQTPNSEEHAVKGDPLFTDLTHRDFTLTENSPAIGRGEKQNNINQQEEPDMGAFALGENSLYPHRPMDVEADNYYLSLNPKGSATVQVRIGDIESGLTYQIRKGKEMDWVTIDNISGDVTPESNLTFQIKLDSDPDELNNGVFFIRFSNGFSIPVTIRSDPQEVDAIQIPKTSETIIFKLLDNKLTANLPYQGRLDIYDITGSKFYSTNCEEGELSIPLYLQNGLYIISFISKNEVKSVQKLLIN